MHLAVIIEIMSNAQSLEFIWEQHTHVLVFTKMELLKLSQMKEKLEKHPQL